MLLLAGVVAILAAATIPHHMSKAEGWWRKLTLGIESPSIPLLLLLTVVGIAMILFLWRLPQWQAAHSSGVSDENRFDRENEARKTLAQIVAGALVLAGLYSSVQTLSLTHEGQITDRFTKATEQLGALDDKGHVKLEVRLGGIYALERIARDSKRDHRVIMEILTTYVRVHAPRKNPDLNIDGTRVVLSQSITQGDTPRIAADIQSIITVLGRREAKYDEIRYEEDGLDLSNVDLHKSTFSGDYMHAHFAFSDLHGADFSGVNLSEAHFIFADLHDANLRGATLRGANFLETDFGGADLRGTDVRGTDLRYAKNLTQGQLETANGDLETFIPPSLKSPGDWKH